TPKCVASVACLHALRIRAQSVPPDALCPRSARDTCPLQGASPKLCHFLFFKEFRVMPCTTPMDMCPTGCGTDLVFLRACRSRAIVLYCYSCGTAFNVDILSDGDASVIQGLPDFEPEGVRFVSRREIEEAGWG